MVKVDYLVCPASAGVDLVIPVLSFQSHGSLDKVGDHVGPLKSDESHRHIFPRSEVLSSNQ